MSTLLVLEVEIIHFHDANLIQNEIDTTRCSINNEYAFVNIAWYRQRCENNLKNKQNNDNNNDLHSKIERQNVQSKITQNISKNGFKMHS